MVRNSSKATALNKEAISNLESRTIRKWAELKNKSKENKYDNKGNNRFASLRESLYIPRIKVISHLTKFKSRPREIKLIESIRLPKTPPEQFVSSRDFFRLKDPKEKKDFLKSLGYSHIVTIYAGNTIVKYAYSDHFKSQVAIKTELRPPLYEEGKYEMLKNELETMLNIQHQNLSSIYEYLLSDYEIHTIMEYHENGTLSDLIMNVSFLPEYITQKMFQGLAEGLRFCHKKSIFHRNITCDNIYISEQMHLKLANFRSIKKGTHYINEPLGALIYTAPEVYHRIYTSGFLADMWSMGYVLYVMLIGSYPYSIEEYKQLKNKSCMYVLKPPRNVRITMGAQSVINSLLCVPPMRLTSKRLLKHPWFDASLDPNTFSLKRKKKDRNILENENTDVEKTQPKLPTVKSERILNIFF